MTLARLLVLAAALLVLLVNTVAAQGLQYRVHPVDGWNDNWRVLNLSTDSHVDYPHGVTASFFGYEGAGRGCNYVGSNRIHVGTDFRTIRTSNQTNASRIVAPVDGEIVYYRYSGGNAASDYNRSFILFRGDDGLEYVFAHVNCAICDDVTTTDNATSSGVDAYGNPISSVTGVYQSSRRVVQGELIGQVFPSVSGFTTHLHLGVINPDFRHPDTSPLVVWNTEEEGYELGVSYHNDRVTVSWHDSNGLAGARTAANRRGFVDPASVFGGSPARCGGMLNSNVSSGNAMLRHAAPLNRTLAGIEGQLPIRSNVGATREEGEPLDLRDTSSVWFHFTAQRPSSSLLDVPYWEEIGIRGNFQGVLHVFESSVSRPTSFSQLVQVASSRAEPYTNTASNPNPPLRFSRSVVVRLHPGRHYVVAVAGSNGWSRTDDLGTFQFETGRIGDFQVWRVVTENPVCPTPSAATGLAAMSSSECSPTSTALAPLANATFGQPVNLTATVTAGTGTPVGTVRFMRTGSSTPLATTQLNANGIATAQTTTLPVGTHEIRAHYDGSQTHAASVSPPRSVAITQAVGAPTQTTAQVQSGSIAGTNATFQARVTSDAGTPSGMVDFRRDGIVFASAALDASGWAQVTSVAPTAGSYSIEAVYRGAGSFAGSISPPRTWTVSAAPPQLTETILGLTQTEITEGSSLAISATVRGSETRPMGNVLFFANGNLLDRVALFDSGIARESAAGMSIGSLNEGVYLIHAFYEGDVGFEHSQSGTQVVRVNAPQRTPTRTVLSGPETIRPGDSVTLTAHVTHSAGNALGRVRLDVNGNQGTVRFLSSGQASWTFNMPATGGDGALLTFDAIYYGTGDLSPSLDSFVRTVLPVQAPPPNDLFVNRTLIAAPGLLSGSNVGATAEPGQPWIASPNSTNAVWWRFTPTVDGTLVAATCESDFDTTLAVFSGGSVSMLQEVASNTNACGSDGRRSRVMTEVVGGREYQIAVAGYNNAIGNVVLGVSFQPEPASLETVTTISLPSSSIVGDSIPVSVNVTSEGGVPSGTVTFFDEETGITTQTLVNGSASADLAPLPVGTRLIRAEYNGSGQFASSSAGPFAHEVHPATQTSTTQLSGPARSRPGEAPLFTATVTVEDGSTPTGNVLFFVNNTEMYNVQLSANGMALVAIEGLSIGSHEILARYTGVPGILLSTSDPFLHTVTAATANTTTRLAGPTRGLAGEALTFTAAVTSDTGTPAGTVHLLRDGQSLGSFALDTNGVAHAIIDGLPEGDHMIHAEYQGVDGYAPSSSTEISVWIAGAASEVAQMAVGGSHACALTFGGDVYCWGGNWSGQLGDRTQTDRFRARPVRGLRRPVTEIATGINHTCALLVDGGVMCWGANFHGQLGNSSAGDLSTTPVQVARSRNSRAVSAHDNSSCLLDEMRRMKCWGGNSMGQLGHGTRTFREDTPRIVRQLGQDMASLAIGGSGDFNCALNEIGRVFCWGANSNGQLGDGTTTDRLLRNRVDLPRPRDWQMVAMGKRHSCALNARGHLYCWGANSSGQIGDGSIETRETPVRVDQLPGAGRVIALGENHSCALNRAGRAFCWGSNSRGQLGAGLALGETSTTPIRVMRLGANVRQIASGERTSCAIKIDGVVMCWGSNQHGQLGISGWGASDVPVRVRGLPR